MTHGTSTPQPQPSPDQQSDPVTFYWLATIETTRGVQTTCDGTMPATPGAHTRMTTARAVMDFLKKRHGELVVLFLYLEPNEISAPAVTA